MYLCASVWIRDVTEEGIEPHPGPRAPRVLTKNLNSLVTRFQNTMFTIACEHARHPIRVLFLQEHGITRQQAEDLKVESVARRNGLLYVQAHKPDAEGKGGTAIVVPIDMIERRGKETPDQAAKRVANTAKSRQDGRMVRISLDVEGKPTKLASIYAPVHSPDRPDFFDSVSNDIDSDTVIGTDANCHIAPIDAISHAASGFSNRGSRELQQIISTNSLIDVTRESIGDNSPFYTNFTHVGGGQVSKRRIDLILAPHRDAEIWALEREHKDFLTYDTTFGHKMVCVTMVAVKDERGRDLETINEKVFEDASFNAELASAIQDKMQTLNPQDGEWRDAWEQVKAMVKSMCLDRTQTVRKELNKEIDDLRSSLRYQEADITAGHSSASDHARRKELQDKIRALTKKSKSLHDMLEKEAYTAGQKHDVNTAAFHRQWSPKNGAQWVQEVMIRDWSDPSNPQPLPPNADGSQPADTEDSASKIAEGFTSYYKPLFTAKQNDAAAAKEAADTLLDGNRVLKPTAHKCGAPITMTEVRHTSVYLPTGKSPGPDRIPNAFYKTLSKVVSPILAKVFNESVIEGSLPTTMMEGTISVLYKKNNRDDPRNYRPITLLNNDYKILMRILTQRMNEAVVQFVSADQNGFVPHAFIAENIMRLQLLQEYIEDQNIAALYLFCDMEKAFDKCSWDFLIQGLDNVGLGATSGVAPPGTDSFQSEYGVDRSFIDFVKLAYSTAHPPKRRMYVNGYLGPEFELGSGVAQGCPLSPLLFLIIAEPLTRLINRNRDIEGVRIKTENGTYRHKISQFADDSTLILLLRDITPALDTLELWQAATCMKENAGKREILPLGPLKRQYNALPPRLTPPGARVAKLGERVTALGAPLGNDFDLEDWWLARYQVVKPRIAAWNGLGRLSLEGRNILLQSILYGSMRYWFFFLPVPESIIDIIESDAKVLLWSAAPEFSSGEVGTALRSHRWIRETASYIPKKKGGAGLMHLAAHILGFQAQWISRYLDPRESPWKNVLDYWMVTDDKLGRGAILTGREMKRRARNLPPSCQYMRECFEAFEELNIQQDQKNITFETQGEPAWVNDRFYHSLDEDFIEEWEDRLDTHRLSDFVTPRGFAANAYMHAKITTAARAISRVGMRRAKWIDDRKLDVPVIRAAVPLEVRQQLSKPPPAFKDGEIVYITDRDEYARYDSTAQPIRLHLLWLDTSRLIHQTGVILHLGQHRIEHVSLWTAANNNYVTPYKGDEDDNDTPEELTSVIGPTRTAFPLNVGWHAEGQSTTIEGIDGNDRPRRLSDVTVHEVTVILTERLVGDARPSCETNWPISWRRHGLGQLKVNWRRVWSNVGTKLSDPTEEKAWRRLLHRAIDARNRHPATRANPNPDHTCRLRCGCQDESMLHMLTCPRVWPFWEECFTFCEKVLGEKIDRRQFWLEAVIFNVNERGEQLKETTRAFLRHAIRWWYADLTAIQWDPSVTVFNYQHCFWRTLRGYRSAVIRWAYDIRRHYIKREHTHLVEQVGEVTRKQFSDLVTVSPYGYWQLAASFQRAITRAEAAAAN